MKHRKTSRKRFNIEKFAARLFAVTSVLYLLTSVGLRSYNSYLNVIKQQYDDQIAALTKDKETAQMEVNQLSTYDRISAIASADGMSVTTNIVTVTANE